MAGFQAGQASGDVKHSCLPPAAFPPRCRSGSAWWALSTGIACMHPPRHPHLDPTRRPTTATVTCSSAAAWRMRHRSPAHPRVRHVWRRCVRVPGGVAATAQLAAADPCQLVPAEAGVIQGLTPTCPASRSPSCAQVSTHECPPLPPALPASACPPPQVTKWMRLWRIMKLWAVYYRNRWGGAGRRACGRVVLLAGCGRATSLWPCRRCWRAATEPVVVY